MRTFFTILRLHYSLIGNKFFFLLAVMLMAVGLQGLSLGLFVPILQGENGDSKISLFFKKIFAVFHLDYSLSNLLIMLVVLFFLRSVCMMGQRFIVIKFFSDLLVDLRVKIVRQLFRIDYQAYVKESAGYINNALIVEIPQVIGSFRTVAGLLISCFFVLLYIGIPLFLNPLLVVLLLVMGVPLFFIVRKINILTREYSVSTSYHSAGMQDVLIQSLQNFKYLKATAEYPRVIKQLFEKARKYGDLQVRQGILGAFTSYGFEPFVVLFVAGIVYYYVGIKGQDIVENLFLFYLLYNAMLRILQLQGNFRKLYNVWGSVSVYRKVNDIIDKWEETFPCGAQSDIIPFDGPIRFENVGFAFEGREKVLRNITAEIPPHTTAAFVGESGAGKTTVVNIIAGLLRPTEGKMYIGDKAYSEINMEGLRKGIGYITQENVIFNDTVFNNITLWEEDRSEQTMKKIEEVLRKSHLDTFVEQSPKGSDMPLGEGGVNISGGQRQRFCIARELYKDAKILIFDEATSSLDTKTEIEIQKNIDEFKGEKTIIIIAHRLSTVKNADKIFVLKNGAVVEEGTYEDLCGRNGEFRKMIDQQSV